MHTAVVRAYRGLLRELWKSSVYHHSARNAVICANLRTSLMEHMLDNKTEPANPLRNVNNTTTFLYADRNYKTLLKRYSPLHDLSEEEKIKATAQRVGLNTPVEYKQ